MVDPNPARGMPAQLQRYWLAGKGAAKIRWNVPGDFKRCVRAITKYFPTNPEGLCNILHTKATGGPPGHGSAERDKHSIDDQVSLTAAAGLLSMQQLGSRLWMGPVAPIGVPTAEPRRMRVFEPGAFSHRTLPLPLKWRKADAPGHEGAVTVGRILGLTYGPDHLGQEFAWAWGDWLDEEKIPESATAQYMVEQGILGASVDPGGKVVVSVNPANGGEYTSQYVIGGVTLVSTAAFDGMQIRSMGHDDWDDDDEDMAISVGDPELVNVDNGCGCGVFSEDLGAEGDYSYAINPSGWEGLPLAPRDYTFDNDDALKRIAAWAGLNAQGADVSKLHRAFLWRDPRLPETQTQSYRLPVGDIVGGELTLVFHAIYAAAALISGAHGGLPLVSEQDKDAIRNVITDIYKVMAAEFNDSNLRAPWDRPENEGQQFAMSDSTYPLAPPRSWFDDPQLEEKTPLTVTEDGQVFGHIAAWNECHRDVSNKSCVLAPKSHKDYAPFHLGTVITAEGESLKVGKIVQDTRHADVRLGYAAAAIHYDDTGDEAAVVRAGEDAYGIWVAGAVVPDATPRKVAKLRRSPISGDWRGIDGHLELTAALAVNVPAFPVYAFDGGEQFSLVAAGVVYPDLERDLLPRYEVPHFGITPSQDTVPVVDMDALAQGVLTKLREMQRREDRALAFAKLQEELNG